VHEDTRFQGIIVTRNISSLTRRVLMKISPNISKPTHRFSFISGPKYWGLKESAKCHTPRSNDERCRLSMAGGNEARSPGASRA